MYCQVGRTIRVQVERQTFYKTEVIARQVEKKVKEAESRGERIDYLTFVPDGEPTLDVNLGEEIRLLKNLGIKIAVISNASLIGREDVRKDLGEADWVSVKIDAVSTDIWRRLNRPHRSLSLDDIRRGISEFSRSFGGVLTTETMLVRSVNDKPEEILAIAEFIAGLNSGKSYLSIPTRPPADKRVRPASEYTLAVAYHLFHERSIDAEYLIGYEGNAFAFTGNVEEDLLSITSVHPMREDAVQGYLLKARGGWDAVHKLLEEEKLLKVDHGENTFFLRNIQPRKRLHSETT
jgi:wyosine [tRNA(Phe)-imidazoG37] synthetase (radical SAM superfamily)